VFLCTQGAHHSSDDTTSNFIAKLTSVLTSIQSCFSSPTSNFSADLTPSHLIYLTQPAEPPRQDEYVRNINDHRTNIRQQHWAELASAVALENGWSVVDQFALTQPYVWEPLNTDMAHFLATDAMDPIVDEVIDKAGLCPDDQFEKSVMMELSAST